MKAGTNADTGIDESSSRGINISTDTDVNADSNTNMDKGMDVNANASAGADTNIDEDKYTYVDAYMDTNAGTYREADIVIGWYVKVNKSELKQGESIGEITNGGGGIYGGYIGENWEIKLVGEKSYDVYSSARDIEIEGVVNRTAKADFKGTSTSGSIEGAVKADVGIEMQIRPYVGLDYTESEYGEIKESGAESLDLVVEGGVYKRMSARVGIGITQNVRKFNFGADIEYKRLLVGQQPTITGKFATMDFGIKTLGVKEGENVVGIKAAGNYDITGSVGIFAKVGFFASMKCSSLEGNVGAVYKF
jgi:hypothetical protein